MKAIMLALLSSLLFLAGCGPIYDTRYDLLAPTDDAGRFCVVECERMSSDCRRAEERKHERCERDNREQKSEYERCRRKHGENANKHCGFNAPVGSYCPSANVSGCDRDYRRCFQNCGGEIQTHQVCVFNCP